MRTTRCAMLVGALLCSDVGLPCVAGGEKAEPAEIIAKVREAAAMLTEEGAAALDTLRSPESRFTWKDTYVFVVDCDADMVMANPAFPVREGGDIKKHTDYGGKQYGLELCETAKRPGGGWVEYTWPPPGSDEPARKISYVVSVEGGRTELVPESITMRFLWNSWLVCPTTLDSRGQRRMTGRALERRRVQRHAW